jgi:hypothetical protein
MLDYLYGTKSEITLAVMVLASFPLFFAGLLGLGIAYDKSLASSPQANEVRFWGWFGIYSLILCLFTALVTPWVAVAFLVGSLLYYWGGEAITSLKRAPAFFSNLRRFFAILFRPNPSTNSTSSTNSTVSKRQKTLL